MMTLLFIRRLRPEDFGSIVEIARGLPQWFTESGIQEITRDIQTHEGFVALDEERVVGFATFTLLSDTKTAELSWIGVHPQLHRKGIGRTLVNAVEGDLLQRGFLSLEVSTVARTVEYEPYARTQRFYYAVGFSDLRIDKGWYPSGDDRLLLSKQLGRPATHN
jgi:ribosomal protein S18 acetylase RimI-like enzyme